MKKIQEVIYRAEESNEHSHEIIEILREKNATHTVLSGQREATESNTRCQKSYIWIGIPHVFSTTISKKLKNMTAH